MVLLDLPMAVFRHLVHTKGAHWGEVEHFSHMNPDSQVAVNLPPTTMVMVVLRCMCRLPTVQVMETTVLDITEDLLIFIEEEEDREAILITITNGTGTRDRRRHHQATVGHLPQGGNTVDHHILLAIVGMIKAITQTLGVALLMVIVALRRTLAWHLLNIIIKDNQPIHKMHGII